MHVLIPHASSLAEPAQALWPTLRLPQLGALLQRLARQPAEPPPAQGERSLSAPHERHLAALLGLPGGDGLIPWAAWRHWQAGCAADGTPRAMLTLCHWQVTTQQVRLLHPAHLQLAPEEDRALLATLSDFFAADGLALAATDEPGRWLAAGEPLRELPCASLDRLLGPDVDAAMLGMAGHAAARTIRRLQNETQMLLYTHPVNEAREARGALPVNAFVLDGAGAWQPPPAYDPPGLLHWRGDGSPPPPAPGAILRIDTLREAALREDWSGWAAAWQALDRQLARPEWQAASRHIGFALTLCGGVRCQSWHGQAASGWQSFWHKLKNKKGHHSDLELARQL